LSHANTITAWAPNINGGPDGPLSDASWDFVLEQLTRIVPTQVTGRRIKRTAATVLTGLPSVAEWCGRSVWVPPMPSSLAAAS
jgi:hypothetical protein